MHFRRPRAVLASRLVSDRRPTLADVARVAGVHKATASRALNEATVTRVQPATARRVQAAAKQLGYRPNAYARGLRTRVSRTIGVLLPDIVDPVFPPVVKGIEAALTARGYAAILANTDGDTERERAAFDSLLARQVDGLIVAGSDHLLEALTQSAADGTPVVSLTRAGHGGQFVSTVTADSAAGVEAVIDHLVALGHRRIAALTVPTPPNGSAGSARGGAALGRYATLFRAAARARGLTDEQCPIVAAPGGDVAAGTQGMRQLLRCCPQLTAVAAQNDLLAVGALRELRTAGLVCPDHISVIGCNDIPLATELTPALSTVRLPGQQHGVVAAETILGTIGSTAPARHLLLPVTLVARQSCGPAR